MASSDDEVEDFPEFVSEYYFEDDKEEPISFAVLPVCWNKNECVEGSGKKIYVRGNHGLDKLYKPVKAWKFDICGLKPEICVLSENKKWIKLQKPRNVYEAFSRTALITVRFLHLVKRHPGMHGKDLWDNLANIFCLLNNRPSLDDLIDHKALIEKAVKHDESLMKSKYLMTCLENSLQKKNKDQENARSKGKDAFIVDDDDLEEGGSVDGDAGSDEEDGDMDMFDSVCAICDEGGSILCCEGICMRSFHATPRAAREADSKCRSLGFSTKEVEAMQTFKCQNCQHKLHQCYSCGLLGSSDKESGAAEVFQCVNATCGYFYHPGCVAKRLHRKDEDASKALQKNIAAGVAFACPLHVCFICRQPEDKTDSELRMAVCRRCPKAYHKKCLPREIVFEYDEDEGLTQRAWDNLLADRILIYCLNHEIDEDLGTPRRNHVKFPGDEKKESQPSTLRMMKHKVVAKNKKASVTPSRFGPGFEMKRTIPGDRPCKIDKKISNAKGSDTLTNTSVEKKFVSTKVELKSSEQLDSVKPKTLGKVVVRKSVLELDSDSKRRILKLVKEASSRLTFDDLIAKHEKLIPDRAYKQRMDSCKSLTDIKVKNIREAIRAASAKLDEGGSIEDAKAICQPNILDQVAKWKNKFKVYLSPFLHGMRYTSFGRHFTQNKKLQEIVDKIHWYVNSNDTIVDFCCGANDFSRLMKKKLESMGKTCNYKNYDLFQPKNDFSFEKRDWMTVQPKELPTGSQLIMGLNPPFGVRAGLANQFINKALVFKPKLLILIVPQETERLDNKKIAYDLIWEDADLLSGKSFYLPGSVDVHDKQMDDWNLKAPVLYLWSRHDWTDKHRAIANKHSHQHEAEKNNGNHANRPGPEQSAEHVGETKVDNLRETHGRGLFENNRGNTEAQKKRPSEEIYAKEEVDSFRKYKWGRSSSSNPHQRWPRHSPVSARDGSLSPHLRYQTSPANLDIIDPGQVPYEPTSFEDRRYSRESQPRGYEIYPSDVKEIQDPAQDHFDPSNCYGGPRSGFPTHGIRYEERVGIHSPQTDIHPGGRWSVDAGHHAVYPPPEHPSRIPSDWPPSAIQPYSEPEQRFRLSTFPAEIGYGRMTHLPGVDEYNPGYSYPNNSRMSGYDPNLGHLSGPGVYNQAPQQGYPGVLMGFASRPHGPFHRPHSSPGGWIND